MSLWRFTLDNIVRHSVEINSMWFKVKNGELILVQGYEQYDDQEELSEEGLKFLLGIMDCPLDVSFCVDQAQAYESYVEHVVKTVVVTGNLCKSSVWDKYFCGANEGIRSDPVVSGEVIYHVKSSADSEIELNVRRRDELVMRTEFPIVKGNNGCMKIDIPVVSPKALSFDFKKDKRETMNLRFRFFSKVPFKLHIRYDLGYSRVHKGVFMSYDDYEKRLSYQWVENKKRNKNKTKDDLCGEDYEHFMKKKNERDELLKKNLNGIANSQRGVLYYEEDDKIDYADEEKINYEEEFNRDDFVG